MARIRVTVSPGAERSEILGRHGDGWKARISAAPERGRANEALARLLADVCGVAPKAVRIVSGDASRRKVVEVDGLSETAAGRMLEAVARDRA